MYDIPKFSEIVLSRTGFKLKYEKKKDYIETVIQ